MPGDYFDGLDSIHFDVLREISSIGSGNAISALSKIMDKQIDMSVPQVMLIEFKHAAASLGDPEALVVGILVSLSGDINGMVMFMLNLHSARVMLNYILQEEDGNISEEFNEMDMQCLQEIGNILISSYVTALATLINKKIVSSVPVVALDMAGAILSVPAIEFSKIADKILHIETVFNTESDKVSGYFLLIPDLNSFHTIMSSLGVS